MEQILEKHYSINKYYKCVMKCSYYKNGVSVVYKLYRKHNGCWQIVDYAFTTVAGKEYRLNEHRFPQYLEEQSRTMYNMYVTYFA